MVDFRKRLSGAISAKKTHPLELYETLDRESDKGELRRAQEAVLSEWYEHRRNEKNLILKLHTGQGKTLIGLLILQAKLNEDPGPALYLCPNNFLIDQTCAQARQFGIETCIAEGDLPDAFLEGHSILVSSVQKLFNGRTKFRLGNRSVPVSYIVLDDCHACVDSIRNAFTIRISAGHDAYGRIVRLFKESLRAQGAGTFAEIESGNSDSLLPIPYWDWIENIQEVVKIIGEAVTAEDSKKEKEDVWFVWPLLKDILDQCQCLISGKLLEISPYIAPLHKFGSFMQAKHRVFMSATVTNDAFLVKGLRLDVASIKNPLVYKKEKWSGEKMIIIPSLIDSTLSRETMLPHFAKPDSGRDYGVVALVPSFFGRAEWEKHGSLVATSEKIAEYVSRLEKGDFERAIVLANRYDGIDLPDRMCRLLVFDSKPRGETLLAAYEQECRSMSDVTAMRDARMIEQGLGRSVRGEKDFCAIVLLGSDLVKFVRNPLTRKHLSSQTRTQIEIGLEIAKYAQEDLKGKTSLEVFWGLVGQCLRRDPDWKEFYAQNMEAAPVDSPGAKILDVFETELSAALAHESQNHQKAVKTIQGLIDSLPTDSPDRSWYLQEMARYSLSLGKEECFRIQLIAFNQNRYLLKPPAGVTVKRLEAANSERANLVSEWICQFESYEQLNLAIEEILSRIHFGIKADRFEGGMKDLGKALGFASERPDKEWKEGPDNLWELKKGHYLLLEAKSEVDEKRLEITKSETAQMNNSCAWFKKHYPGAISKNVLIIPSRQVSSAAGFVEPTFLMNDRELHKLRYAVRQFFNEFATCDFSNPPESKIHGWLARHKLLSDDLASDYSVPPREKK